MFAQAAAESSRGKSFTVPRTTSGVTTNLRPGSSSGKAYITSNSRSSTTLRKPRAPVFFDLAIRAISVSDSGVNSSSADSISKNFLYCFTSEFFGSVRMWVRSSSSSGCSGLITGKPADEFGDHAELENVVDGHLIEQARLALFGRGDTRLLAEADHLAAHSLGDDLVEADECAAADEEDVRRVDLNVLLLGMLAAALRRHVGHGPFEHFQERLLHAFARDVPRDGDVLARLADLVDLVDEDDAPLGRLDVKVGGVQELQEQVLDVFADVARLGERGRVADRKGDLQILGQGLGQQGFPASVGPMSRMFDFSISTSFSTSSCSMSRL